MDSTRKLLLAAALLAMGACELGPAQAVPAGQGAQAQSSSQGATLDSTSLEPHPSENGAEVTAMTQNLRAEKVGASQSDRTAPSHLWPSDHAGVVEALRFHPSILVRR